MEKFHSREQRSILRKQVEELTKKTIPMHMPGHKRRIMPSDVLPYKWDITEIDGADDLHSADGILKQAMDRASRLWGSGRTWFLVGGSTCGLLASIRAAAPFGSEVIVARNCHRSVYHAAELGGYYVHWIIPDEDRNFDVCLGIMAEQVKESLRRYPDSAAVIITSPTYEGVVSEVGKIAEACHKTGIPLVVDEAHGAHFGLFEEGGFPDSAVSCGADLVVQSVHKTLPSLTQTALLHLQGDLVSGTEVERQLAVFETSSPSYPLMISIDSCVGLLREDGRMLFAEWKAGLDHFYDRVSELRHIRVWDTEPWQGKSRNAVVRDRGKILINFRQAGLSGAQAAGILRDKYGIEAEMSCGYNVLAMTSCGDSQAYLDILADALEDMDRNVPDGEDGMSRTSHARIPEVHTDCTILKAVGVPYEELPLEECEGKVCGEYLYVYPPGIPILAPGEFIKAEHLEIIGQREADGNPVRHTRAASAQRIACLAE